MNKNNNPVDDSHPFATLFQPIKIGPVTARNRFYQVPHCTALGHANPQAEAALRATKAEGGWGVVCTQEVEIHPSSDISPYLEGRLWDDDDIPAHRLMTDAVHEHKSLAGIELVHNGIHAANLSTRIPPIGPTHRPIDMQHPIQARAMTKGDIKQLRQWYVDAAKRSKQAGYDIVYVYAGHNMALLMHFLLARYNDRSDEYGGSLKNRVRLLKETLSDVRDAVGGDCAVALRLAVDELLGARGLQAKEEGQEIVSMLADIPDLWDVNISGWDNDSATARFEPDEGYQEPYTAFVKKLVKTPVVGVGRYTSPTAMVSAINRGVLDFIGAARPSIADPFLPNKILQNNLTAIRECIGCNICVSSDNVIAPIRCTQNPTMGEEWRRGWHPEDSIKTEKPREVLVVGAGAAGLECALQLAKQNHSVVLAEASTEVGGRIRFESTLPGLSSYRRVSDYRIQQLQTMPQVQLLYDNNLSAKDIVETGMEHVFLATGASWREDGLGRQHPTGFAISDTALPVYTPDDVCKNIDLPKQVAVYDDDHYYMGGVIAEHLANSGHAVTLITPATCISVWTEHTLEQHKIQSRLIATGVHLVTAHELFSINASNIECQCIYSAIPNVVEVEALVMVTSKIPNESLLVELQATSEENEQRFKTLRAIGDSLAPSTIAAAVYSGHLAAREFDSELNKHHYRREIVHV